MVSIWLKLCTSYSSSCHQHFHHIPIKSRMETFWYLQTQIHLVKWPLKRRMDASVLEVVKKPHELERNSMIIGWNKPIFNCNCKGWFCLISLTLQISSFSLRRNIKQRNVDNTINSSNTSEVTKLETVRMPFCLSKMKSACMCSIYRISLTFSLDLLLNRAWNCETKLHTSLSLISSSREKELEFKNTW